MAGQYEKEGFSYCYSAKQQQEIQNIRKKYEEPEKDINKDRFALLKKMDRDVVNKASARALTVGILGTLIMGTGMSCTMVWMDIWFIPGIIIGIVGIALVSLAYPVYERTLKRERKRIAPEILRLSDELMK